MSTERATQVARADALAIERAARALAQGQLVAFPTETVYGLGADAGNGEAVARLYEAKGRPSFNPLIAHVSDAVIARVMGEFDAAADALAAAFWPGPLTLVVRKRPGCPVADLATAGLDSIALRVPDHAVRLFGERVIPVASPRLVTKSKLRPIYHMGSFLWSGAPVWDIRKVREENDLLVRDRPLGEALAGALGKCNCVLMRGHGFTVVGESVPEAVFCGAPDEGAAAVVIASRLLTRPTATRVFICDS